MSDKTWYYALSLEFILDAGVVLDSYETFHNYYEKCVGKKRMTIHQKVALKNLHKEFLVIYNFPLMHILFVSNCNYFNTRVKNDYAAQDGSKFCIWRDPQSLCRLLTCQWLYQLRM